VLLLRRLHEVGGLGRQAAIRELLRDAEKRGRFRERNFEELSRRTDEKLRVRVPHNPEK